MEFTTERFDLVPKLPASFAGDFSALRGVDGVRSIRQWACGNLNCLVGCRFESSQDRSRSPRGCQERGEFGTGALCPPPPAGLVRPVVLAVPGLCRA